MAGNEQWKHSRALPHIALKPSGAELLIRTTTQGTLYFLFDKDPSVPFTLRIPGHGMVVGGLDNYALVHERNGAVDLVEASGDVDINGTPFYQVERGRAIIWSTNNSGLVHSSQVRLTVTEPTLIRFQRKIQRVYVREPGRSKPIASFSPHSDGGKLINIDDELARYVLEVEF